MVTNSTQVKVETDQHHVLYNESHSAYDEDIENKGKMLSLIIKKVWYIPFKKKKNNNKNNSKRKQIEITKMSSYP